MKLFLRILLFTTCIITATHSVGFADEELVLSDETQTQLANYEQLDNDYVQFEVSTDSTISISILKSINNLVKIIQAKYYSLLNWSSHKRTRNLYIENYDRKAKFGRWINDPKDETCYNTRALVLIRDSHGEVLFKDNNHCSVAAGDWNDPYTGQRFNSSQDIQIDHLVPLKNAYVSGAYKWNFKTRCLYANFMGSNYHLLSVNGSQNMRKGDKAPDKYMPPNPEYACTYIKNWLTIKFLWGLRMTAKESQAIASAISENHCNTRMMYISNSEILRQSKFYQETIDLCEKLDTESKKASGSDQSL